MSIPPRHILRTLGIILMVPCLVVTLLVVGIYIPAVQRWAINEVGSRMEASLGMRVHIDEVRITPFLDLVASGLTVTDTAGDTLLATRSLTFDVAFLPLFSGEADISGFRLTDSRLNTKALISDIGIRGLVGRLEADAHGVNWREGHITLPHALLADADLTVALTDTVPADTTAAPLEWVIDVQRASILRTTVAVTLPPDSATGQSLPIDARLSRATMLDGHFDLARPHYAFRQLDLGSGAIRVGDLVNVTALSATIDTLSYNAKGALRCGVNRLTFDEERYDLHVAQLAGQVYADAERFEIPALTYRTLFSRLDASIAMEWAALQAGDLGAMRVGLDAHIGREDLGSLLKTATREGYLDASLVKDPKFAPFLRSDLRAKAMVSGNFDHLRLETFSLALPPHLAAHGNLDIADAFQAYRGQVTARIYGGTATARLAAHLGRETYDVKADLHALPLARLLPSLPLAPLSGHLEASGRGFDPTRRGAHLDAWLDASHLVVADYDLSGLSASATLHDGLATADVALSNALCTVSGQLSAVVAGATPAEQVTDYVARTGLDIPPKGYGATARLEVDNLDLRAVGATEHPLRLHSVLDLSATASADATVMAAKGGLSENRVMAPTRSVEMKDIAFDLATAPTLTRADISAGDLLLALRLDDNLAGFGKTASAIATTFAQQVEGKAIDQEALRRLLPTASLSLRATNDNPVHNFLRFQGTQLSAIDLNVTADSIRGLNGTAHLGRVQIGGLMLDTIEAHIVQDTTGVKLFSTVRNHRRDNPHRFTSELSAELMSHGFGANLVFRDEKGRTGIDLGLLAEARGGMARFSLHPHNPVFAYRTFTINDDNFISIDRQGMIRADVHLVADDGTGLLVYSEPSVERTNDVTLSIYNFNLGELCDVMPYLPRLAGMVNGDFHLIDIHDTDGTLAHTVTLPAEEPQEDEGELATASDTTMVSTQASSLLAGRQISAMGSVEIARLSYEGTPIGDLGAEIVYLPKSGGEHYADAFISYNGTEVGECSGVYHDTDGHFSGHLALNNFPLAMANAFLEGTDFLLRGLAQGDIDIEGTLDNPQLEGSVLLTQSHFYSPVYGVDFEMEERPLVIADSRLMFDDYLLTSGGTKLRIGGDIDMQELSHMRLDLSMNGRNFALIQTARTASSLVYGRLLTDFTGTARGTIDNLLIRGNLNVLPTTDVTYVLTNSPLTVEDRLADLVTFVDFADTTSVTAPIEVSTVRYDVSLGIHIDPGARFHCFLSGDGNSYATVRGGGDLTLRMTQEGDMRLIGRLSMNEGEMNYELPVIPLKKFALQPDSYVEFTGDVMNPRLSIRATETTKAVVSEEGRQRSVNFIVGVEISRTLEDMGLAFTIEAPDDLPTTNLLTSMSAEDRYKSAVAMLATGMFVTEDLTQLKASNALNAFLQSEIQNIAGRALSTFDLSFGMENGMTQTGGLTTDYSFRFSKRFLNDRFSINIGGSVSTGADATNSAASFIDNVSIEYRLDRSGTRYVRVYYDRDAHDMLEGSMMTTGAGLVMRRQTDRLGELFLFRKREE